MSCADEPESPPGPTAHEAREAAEALYASPPVASSPGVVPNEAPGPAAAATVQVGEPEVQAEPIQLVFGWEGIGNLHKSFFLDQDLVTSLGVDLAGHVAEPANVYIRHDGEEFVGWVRLRLLPGTRQAPVSTQGDVIRLQDLRPITQGLAAYRTAVADHYDLRVASFIVGIESFRGADSCVFSLAGAPPPDGSIISPCVEVRGQEQCGEPTPAGVRFSPQVAASIRNCLDL